MKMRRRKGQEAKKARAKKRKTLRAAQETAPAKKTRTPKAAAPAATPAS